MATTRKRKSTSGTRKTASQRRGRRRMWLLLAAVIVGGAYLLYGSTISSFTQTGASYGARVACACVHIGGRDLTDCRKDFEAGMEVAVLSENADAKSVSVTYPLLSSATASYREGYGCVLEEWEA